ncbi:hypothetical protein O1611_g6546 [Lasiodiplodia mahajangana]|uniref:Uncharacterized protein n=1 Tax=Lasiodiplodia mahajangana TaxID=1108764 RepID=A0ACC2JII3_9PEZI|nr:hypothetical protein O1611_g6546 [Lasiodiplodia mahajangana]
MIQYDAKMEEECDLSLVGLTGQALYPQICGDHSPRPGDDTATRLRMFLRDIGGLDHYQASFFKTLIDHEVTVELKNDIQIRGTLKSVDQYLNIKLEDINVVEELKYPHLSSVKNVFIRGSVVRYVHLPAAAVDVPLLEDATRREAANQAGKGK